MESAQVVLHEDGRVYVVCPYCYQLHQHGDAGMTDLSGQHRVAHCLKGSYNIKGIYDFRLAHMMLNRRELDIRRKQEARLQERARREALKAAGK